MQSFCGTRADPLYPKYQARIHPALTSFADECCRTLARLIAYVGALALLAIVGLHLWDQLHDGAGLGSAGLGSAGLEPSAKAGWSMATRSFPAFAVSQPESFEKTAAYEILRHPGGGRKDILRWAAAGEKPVAELEIYRPGGEMSQSGPDLAEIADRMDPGSPRELEAAGIIDSKFGAVALLRTAGHGGDAPACLGFMKRFEQPDVRISGWSCHRQLLKSLRILASLHTPFPTMSRGWDDADVWSGEPAIRPDGLRHRRARD
jgi:hypothetical protein